MFAWRALRAVTVSLTVACASLSPLARSGEDSPVGILLDGLAEGSSPEQRRLVARQVADKGPAAVPDIAAFLSKDGISYDGIMAASEALACMGKDAVPAMIHAVRTSHAPYREVVVLGNVLNKTADVKAIPELGKLATDTQSAETAEGALHKRRVAISVIAKIGGDDACVALEKLLRDPSVGADAARALGVVGGRRAEDALIGLLEDAKDSASICGSLEGLGSLKSVRAVPIIFKYADSVDEAAAISALHALGEIGDVASLARVAKYVDDKREKISMAALEALSFAGAPPPEAEAARSKLCETVAPKLVNILRHPAETEAVEYRRRKAAEALVRLRAPEEAILECLRNNPRDEYVCGQMVEALGVSGGIEGCQELGAILTDTKRPLQLRTASARALGMARPASAFPHLISAMEDKDKKIVLAVALAIQARTEVPFGVPVEGSQSLDTEPRDAEAFQRRANVLRELETAKDRILQWWHSGEAKKYGGGAREPADVF